MFAIVQLAVVLSLCATNIIALCEVKKPVPALNPTNGTPAGILGLLYEGERLLELDQNDRDIVVFMGITGNGKTTFVLHMTGNDEDLTAQEIASGSHEYLIVDNFNRSSSAAKTSKSFTLIPDRFLDSHTKMIYHDMPGFSDTRPDVAYDIAATYFTKKVLDHAERIKLVFVMNHSHLKVSEDRKTFNELVQHVTTFIRDLSKFENSIALVASKVSNVMNPEAPPNDPYVSDQKVTENIAEFLEGMRSFYLEDNQMKAVQLVDIFLHRTNQTLDRIGVFRRPDKPGPLVNITTLQRSKRNTRTIIDTNLRFAKKVESDFGYTLSEKSRNILHKLREEVLKNATESIHALGEHIRDHIQSREYSTTDLSEITSVFIESYIKMSKSMKIAEFANYIEWYVQKVGLIATDVEDIKRLRANEKYMEFFNGISGDAAINWSPAIQDGMSETIEYLHHSYAWYVLFLNNMYETISGYQVQSDRSKIKSHTLSLLNRIEEVEKLSNINYGDLNQAMMHFLKVVGDRRLTDSYISLKTIHIYLNTQKLQVLKKVLNATLMYEVKPNCNLRESIHLNRKKLFMKEVLKYEREPTCPHKPDEFTISGRYLVLSQVVDELDSCPGVRFIRIFALEKIFLDANVNLMNKEVNLIMIAPTWMTVGRVEVNLNGRSRQAFQTEAGSGILSTEQHLRNGEHGRPGAPGGSAGHFYGMGRNFINDEHLTISAIGGNGGDGQKGGDGSPGKSYSKSDTDQVYTVKKTLRRMWPGFFTYIWYVLGFFGKERVYEIEIMYPSPTAGGHGGNGGKGGIGGYKGNVTLVNVCTGLTPLAKTFSQGGKRGTAGKGGKGGPGGIQGEMLIKSYSGDFFWWSSEDADTQLDGWDVSDLIKAPDGFDGVSGANDSGLQYPTLVSSRGLDIDMKDYWTYACDNLRYDMRKNLRYTLECLSNLSEAKNLHCDFSDQSMHHAMIQYLIFMFFILFIFTKYGRVILVRIYNLSI